MQMEITDRHFTLGEEQREMIENTLAKLEKFSPRPVQSVRIVVTHESGVFDTEGVLFLKNHEFRASGQGREPELSVNELVDNLHAQLAKFKGKMTARQKGESGGLGKAFAGAGDLGLSADEGPSHTLILKDMSVDDARETFQAAEQPFLVFRNVQNGSVAVIYRQDDGKLAHMEAAQ